MTSVPLGDAEGVERQQHEATGELRRQRSCHEQIMTRESISIAQESSRYRSCCMYKRKERLAACACPGARACTAPKVFLYHGTSPSRVRTSPTFLSPRAFRWYLVDHPAPTGSPFTCHGLVRGHRRPETSPGKRARPNSAVVRTCAYTPTGCGSNPVRCKPLHQLV